MRKILFFTLALVVCKFLGAQIKDTVGNEDSVKVSVLQEVTVRSKKPAVQLYPDKTVVNVDAAVTNTGATVLEVLEKSPGVTIDRNGNISLKGKQGVLIMIDGKPAQISGTDLNNLLNGMTASQVDQIELMDNPSAKYDASGNAGIINIKTKKNRQKGFNGNLSLSLGQGRFSRTANSLNLNHYSGKINLFANINVNMNRNFMKMFALRKYYEEDNTTLTSILDQPSYLRGRAPSQNIKTGIDYFITKKTTLGTVFNFTNFSRTTTGANVALWKDAQGNNDSAIGTTNNLKDKLKSYAVNLNARHSFNAARELTADFDYLGYRINNNLFFNNQLNAANGYDEDIFGHIPSELNIFTGKADYTENFTNQLKFESGWKSSHIRTNNIAEYFVRTGGTTLPDFGKTNHFLYEETIHAAYVSMEKKMDKLTLQGGLRYEFTTYNAHQLGMKQEKTHRSQENMMACFQTSWRIGKSIR